MGDRWETGRRQVGDEWTGGQVGRADTGLATHVITQQTQGSRGHARVELSWT